MPLFPPLVAGIFDQVRIPADKGPREVRTSPVPHNNNPVGQNDKVLRALRRGDPNKAAKEDRRISYHYRFQNDLHQSNLYTKFFRRQAWEREHAAATAANDVNANASAEPTASAPQAAGNADGNVNAGPKRARPWWKLGKKRKTSDKS
ncbi:hypothetical protein PRZ48_009223 [Zasmidium cellare]|uniref:Uncharacterized protein n=1 Tax=Zasmidium cellare TaxID=395010 RepID=A0ABR0ECC1_ZASCE|nr:hypothetical protein PRZ48_009223 [Zasmidium cellare]